MKFVYEEVTFNKSRRVFTTITENEDSRIYNERCFLSTSSPPQKEKNRKRKKRIDG